MTKEIMERYEREISWLTHEIERRELSGNVRGAKFLADWCEEAAELYGTMWPLILMEHWA